jgi:hypothetical protein
MSDRHDDPTKEGLEQTIEPSSGNEPLPNRVRAKRADGYSGYFTPSVPQGWKLRARFPAQDGYARSAIVKK